MDPYAAGAMALGGLAGSLMDSGENFGPGNQYPDWMLPQLRQNINQLDERRMNYYDRPTVANWNPQMWEANSAQRNFGQPGGQGFNNTFQMGLAGGAGLQAGVGGIDYLRGLQEQGPNQFNYDQGTFDTTMNNLMPGLQGSYDAAMRDPIRQFNEQTVPGINMGASGAGQAFGTRGSNATAIAARGLQDRAADTAAGLWANAANQANAGGMRGGELNLNSANDMVNTLSQGYQNYGQLGTNQMNQAYNMGVGNLNLNAQGAQNLQNYQQSMIDADKARWDFNQQEKINQPQRAIDAMQALRLGGTPGQSGPSTASNVWNGVQAGLGFYNAFAPQQGMPDNTTFIPPPPANTTYQGGSNIFDQTNDQFYNNYLQLNG